MSVAIRSAIAVLGVVLLVLVLVVLILSGPRMWDTVQLQTGWGLPTRVGPPLLIVAHHGDMEAYPEDSAEAIWSAAALQPDGIEIDVHRSASGTWYVIHDPTLDRTTDGQGQISALSDEIIDSAVIDAGRGFNPDHASLRVPRLVTVVDGLKGFQGRIYLDIQHAESGDPAELVELTKGKSVAIICRSAAEAAAVKASNSSVETLLRVYQPLDPGVDGLVADARLDASPRLMASWTLPLTVYVAESQFAEDEYPLLRSAWATGVKAFITNHLADALRTRDGFVGLEPSAADGPEGPLP